MKLRIEIVIFSILLSFFTPLLAHSSHTSTEAGLITSLSGKVSYKGMDKKKEVATPFMKTKVGDVFTLEDGALLQIVFFKNGRKEKWKGGVEIIITENEGRVSPVSKNKKATPEGVSTFGNNAESLREIPLFIQDVNTERAGSTTSRGKFIPRKFEELDHSEKQRVSEVKFEYDKMQKAATADDVTPELYAIWGLIKLRLGEEAYELTKVALKKQPDNKGLVNTKEELEKLLKEYNFIK